MSVILHRGNRRAAALALMGLLAVGGCAQPPEAEPGIGRVWPPPPEAPRLRLVRVLRGAKDFGRPGLLEGLGDLISGPRRHTMALPQAAALDGDRHLYVADPDLHGVHVFDLHSSQSAFIDSTGREPLQSPVGVAACEENLAVADSTLKLVALFTPAGKFLRAFEKPGGFQRPTGLAYDAPRKHLWVVDTLANEVCVFDLSGRLLRRFGSRGVGPGQFNYPTHVFVDARGTAYVTDSLNFRVQVFNPAGQAVAAVGRQGDASGHLGVPKGVVADAQGRVYIADSYFATVHVFDAQGRFLLDFGEPGAGGGSMEVPCGLALGPDGRVYVCDSHNHRLQVFEYIGDAHAQGDPNR